MSYSNSGQVDRSDAANDDISLPASTGIRCFLTETQPQDTSSAIPEGFFLNERGIFNEAEVDSNGDASFLCSPLRVTALVRDRPGAGWGRLIWAVDHDGVERTFVISDEMFASGNAVIKTLLGKGVKVSSDSKSRATLMGLLQVWQPAVRLNSTDRFGWSDETCTSFVCGDERVIGNQNTIFQRPASSSVRSAMKSKGSLDEWRTNVAALCRGNPLLTVGVSMAFAGPLLELFKMESGGLHLRGTSSCGKTTVQGVAASVWGSPEFVQSWRATANGLEGAAVTCNSTLMVLDEMGQVSAKEVGDAIYMLGNGAGKVRADSIGAAKASARWRMMILSSGEISLAEKMAETGKSPMPGQEVRLLDIAADGFAYGAFDDLHGMANGAAFSDILKSGVAASYGTAGPEFVRFLVKRKTDIERVLPKVMENFRVLAEAKYGCLKGGQTERAVRRFAILAAAGELATTANLTGWDRGIAQEAALAVLGGWLDGRSHAGSKVGHDAIERTREFLTSFGSTRFQEAGSAATVENHAGWFNADVYYIKPEIWREIHVGFNATSAARHLVANGYLSPGDGQNLACRAPRSIPDRPRVYTVKRTILDGSLNRVGPLGPGAPIEMHGPSGPSGPTV